MMAKLTVCVATLLMLLVALGEGSPIKTCCTQYHESPIPQRMLRYYIFQDVTQYCNIEAIIFKTMKNRLVCANPDSEWVQRAIEIVPEIYRGS